jgi:hypothetical protein
VKNIPDDESWVIPPDNSILLELVSESNKLLANAQTSYDHRGGRGDHRESLIRDLIKTRLPLSMDTCKGIVQDSNGARTSEFDLLLFDPNYRMVIAHANEERLVLPIESVVAAIEIRTKINKTAISDAAKKIDELSTLQRHYTSLGLGGNIDRPPKSLGFGARGEGPFGCVLPIPVFLVGFESTQPEALAADWETNKNSPDLVCCIGQYALSRVGLDKEWTLIDVPDAALAVLMLKLTGEILWAKSSNVVPDLLRYFQVPETSK